MCRCRPCGWGRFFSTGLTITRLHFQKRYRNEVAHFRDFGGAKSLVSNHLKIGRLAAEKATRMGLITSHKIDDNGIGVLNGQRYIPNKN